MQQLYYSHNEIVLELTNRNSVLEVPPILLCNLQCVRRNPITARLNSPLRLVIMYRLVEFAQNELKGLMIREHLHNIELTLFGREITLPVADIL